jgi:DNA-binding NtrC family response regulator
LNTVPIKVPSLQERKEDIPLLFRKFAVDFAENYRTEPVRLDEQAKVLLKNYRWPGNVRELKNVAEQISVLSDKREVTAEDLIRFIPNVLERNLPMIPEARAGAGGESFQEREILYKLLFEMKSDLNDLKSLVFELIRGNDLSVPDSTTLRNLGESRESIRAIAPYREEEPVYNHNPESYPAENKPVILHPEDRDAYDRAEVIEENLSLEEMEKELIQKALKKYGGRRKEAAEELGISERTLYRKIKQYELQ